MSYCICHPTSLIETQPTLRRTPDRKSGADNTEKGSRQYMPNVVQCPQPKCSKDLEWRLGGVGYGAWVSSSSTVHYMTATCIARLSL